MSLWDDKKYVDLWSIVHFLSGILLYGIFWWLEWELIPAFALSVSLLILWEVFEYLIKILEPSPNVVIDIGVAIVGFFIPPILGLTLIDVTVTGYLYIGALNLLLAIWGFINYLRRKNTP